MFYICSFGPNENADVQAADPSTSVPRRAGFGARGRATGMAAGDGRALPPPKPRSRLRREAERAEPDRAASLCKRSIPEPEQRAGPFLSRYGLKRLSRVEYEALAAGLESAADRQCQSGLDRLFRDAEPIRAPEALAESREWSGQAPP